MKRIGLIGLTGLIGLIMAQAGPPFSSVPTSPYWLPLMARAGGETPACTTNTIGFDGIGQVNTTSGASQYAVTVSNTPPANALVLVSVLNTKASAPNVPTLIASNGFVYTMISTTNWFGTHRLSLFRAMTNGTPANIGIIADFGGANQTGCGMRAVYFTGVETNGLGPDAIVQSVNITNNTANPVITLGALDAGAKNAVYACFANNVNGYLADGFESGWTKDIENGYNNPASGQLNLMRLATTDNTPSLTDGAQAWGGIAVEIRAGTAGGCAFIDFVQSWRDQNSASGTELVAASTNAVVSGHLILVYTDHYGAGTTITVKDGNTYSSARKHTHSTGTEGEGEVVYLVTASGGITSVTQTLAAARANRSIAAYEYRYKGTISLDAANSAESNGGTTSVTSGNVTTTANVSVGLAGYMDNAFGTVSSRQINGSAAEHTQDTTQLAESWDKEFSSTYTGQATGTSTVSTWLCILAAFKVVP